MSSLIKMTSQEGRLQIHAWSCRTSTWWPGMFCTIHHLMSVVQKSNGDFVPFIQKFECSKWQGDYMAAIQKIVQSNMNCHLFKCFPDFPETTFGDTFIDVPGPDGFTSLPISVFCWLMNIQSGYLVFRHGNICTIEPYIPSRFSC